MMEKELMREKILEILSKGAFAHIVTNAFHYNGWFVEMDSECVSFRDKKTDDVLIIKISDISLVEEKSGRKDDRHD